MLSIKHVQVEDAGNYTCIASNPLSEDRTSTQLFVEGDISRFRFMESSSLVFESRVVERVKRDKASKAHE